MMYCASPGGSGRPAARLPEQTGHVEPRREAGRRLCHDPPARRHPRSAQSCVAGPAPRPDQ
eukprot:3238418-Pyramimonas_sp.AAC.1